jgi:hypothetical protein
MDMRTTAAMYNIEKGTTSGAFLIQLSHEDNQSIFFARNCHHFPSRSTNSYCKIQFDPCRTHQYISHFTRIVLAFDEDMNGGHLLHLYRHASCCIFSFQVSFLAKRRYQSSAFIKLSQQGRPTMSRLKAMESQVSVFLWHSETNSKIYDKEPQGKSVEKLVQILVSISFITG